MHHAGALVKSGQAGRQISRESFFGGHLFQAAGQLAQSFCPTGGGVCHDRHIVSHIPVVFCQCQTGVDAGFTGSNRHVGSIGDQCSAVHQRISGLWIDQFSEFLQNLCHLVSTFSASDIDDDISVRPLGNLMLCHGLSGSESARNGSSASFGDWKHGINDTLSGDQWNGGRETMACRAGSADWPALCHWKLFLISAGKFQCDQRLFNCVISVLHDLNYGSFQIRRNHTFMRDRVSFGYFCENISAVEIVSHRNGDVGGPFFLFIQRVNGNTAGDKRSPGFCDPLQRAFDSVKNVV